MDKINYIKNNLIKIILHIAIIWIICSFIIYPNLNLLVNTFFQDGEFSFRVFSKVASSSIARKCLKNSFLLAITLSITVNIVGIFIVLVTEYFDIKGVKILKAGYFTTLVFGGIVLASSYKVIYGESGIITNLLVKFFPSIPQDWFTGYLAVVLTMTFATTSNHMIFLKNAIRNIDNQVIEAAKNMGASNNKIIFNILLPTLKPVLFALTILTFLGGLGAVSAPLMLGGKEFQTINPMIITFARTEYSRDIALGLAIFLGISSIILLTIMNNMERGKNFISVSKTKTVLTKQKIESKFFNILVHILAYVLFMIYIFPLVIAVLFSFSSVESIVSGQINLKTLTLAHYIKLFSDKSAFKPFLVSFTYATISSIVVVIFCLTIAKIIHKKYTFGAKFYEYSVLTPWLLPSTLIALGFVTTYDSERLNVFNQVLLGTPLIMFLGYFTTRLPFPFRMLRASFYSVSDEVSEAAKSMGASTLYTFIKVELPIILPQALAVIALVFNGLLSDYDLSVFLYHPLLTPLGVKIMSSTQAEAELDTKGLIFVYSVLLMIISSLVIYFVYGRESRRKKN